MPCELKGFRELDISKGIVLVLGKALDLYHPNDIFLVPARTCLRGQPRSRQVPALAFEYSARSLYAGHRLPPVVQAPSHHP